jgi:AcrR family transcriptional regulator
MPNVDTDGRAERGRRRRLEVLEGLEEIFFEEGFRSPTVDQLCERLRCSKRTLYEIGGNKEQMIAAVLTQWSARITTRAEAETAEEIDPAARCAAYLRAGVEESRCISRELLRDISTDQGVSLIFRAHQRARIEGLKAIIGDGVRSGNFRAVNSEFVSAVSLAAIDRIDDPALLTRAGLEFADAFEEFYALLMGGLLNSR